MTPEQLARNGQAILALILLMVTAMVVDELYFRYGVKPGLDPRELKKTLAKRRKRRSRQKTQVAFATGLSIFYIAVMAIRLGLLP